MKKQKKKAPPRKVKGQTPKRNKWNSGEFCRSKLLLGGRGILKTEYSRIVREKQS
jgi:hypothetical protein